MRKGERRETQIDIYKGIGILCIMIGHIGFGGVADKVIHAFHMPMFFLISGFLFREKVTESFREYLIRKAKGLLIPYAIFGLAHYLVWLLCPVFRQEEISLKPLWHLLWINTTRLPIAGALWFLTALFFVSILFFVLRRKIQSDKVLAGIVILLVATGHLCVKYLPVRLPWALDAAFIGSGLFLIGYFLKKYKEHPIVYRMLHMSFWQFIISSVICFVLIWLNRDINMRTGQYTYIVLFWINAVLASVLLYNFSVWIAEWGHKQKGIKLVVNGLELLGKHSLNYVCISQIVMLLLGMVLNRWESEDSVLAKLVVRCGILILTVVTLELMEKYLKISKVGNIMIKKTQEVSK